MRRIAADVIPRIEEAVGLTFKTAPVLAVRDRDHVYDYLVAKLDQDYPPEILDRVVTAYRAFGLVSDTLDVRALLLGVLGEQVVGYYDPDSLTLYVVEGSDPFGLRIIVAHELVHALQGQYAPLDSILRMRNDNDRRSAAHAVLEGQATLASFVATLSPEQFARLSNFWRDLRQSIRTEQARMPAFAAAPLVIREEIVFPYLAGADFMRWFDSAYPDTVPFGPLMPVSTEQILHPEKFRAGDVPVDLRFAAQGAGAHRGALVYQNTWGEFETRIVLHELTESESMGTAGALGWGGDRFAIYQDGSTHALVWWSVWDSERAAEKFATMLDRYWADRMGRDGRRSRVDRSVVGDLPAVRLVDASDAWPGWDDVPAVEISSR